MPKAKLKTCWNALQGWPRKVLAALILSGAAVWFSLPTDGPDLNPNHWNPALMPYAHSGKFGYADKAGLLRIPPQFDGAERFIEGRARILLSGRFGFIDTSGQIVIPARFTWANSFHGGYATVWNGQNWDYLDREGQIRSLGPENPIFSKQMKQAQPRPL